MRATAAAKGSEGTVGKSCLWMLAAALLIPAALPQSGQTQKAGVNPSVGFLKVNLSVPKAIYKVGETIPITYSIESVTRDSREWLYVDPTILDVESVAGFRIEIYDERGNLTRRIGLEALFTGYDPSLDIVAHVQKHWLLLWPGHFYGRRGEVSPDRYEALKKPGRYKIVATYYDTTLDWLTDEQRKALKRLDHPLWSGEVSSDPVWVEILE